MKKEPNKEEEARRKRHKRALKFEKEVSTWSSKKLIDCYAQPEAVEKAIAREKKENKNEMNKNLFSNTKPKKKTKKSKSSSNPVLNILNNANAPAYALPDKEALAQLVVTGCLNNTFYVKAESQLNLIAILANKVDIDYLRQLAIYARNNAYMKDTPALLMAILTIRAPAYARQDAPKVLNNFKMIRNYVQIMRSGTIGRKSLGSTAKKIVRAFFDRQTEEQIFNNSIGQSPSVIDIIKLAHIKAGHGARGNFIKYLMGLPHNANQLPSFVKEYEAFKKNPEEADLPSCDWQMLTPFKLTTKHWRGIAMNMNWHALRMNLNTLKRHEALKTEKVLNHIVNKLCDINEINKAKLLPYQIYTSLMFEKTGISKIRNALQDALDKSLSNVNTLNIDKLFICIDNSSSMRAPVTGHKTGATTKVQCGQVANLYGAGLAKINNNIEVKTLVFNTKASEVKLNLKDSLYTLATSIPSVGGETNCSSAMKYILDNCELSKKDRIAIVYLSDHESWAEYNQSGYNHTNSPLAKLWKSVSDKCKSAKLVLIDLAPDPTTQAPTDDNILNVGGFSDSVFKLTTDFINNENSTWSEIIEKVDLKSSYRAPTKSTTLEVIEDYFAPEE